MSWSAPLEVPKSQPRNMLLVSVAVRRATSGPMRLYVNLNAPVLEAFNNPRRASVNVGIGEDAGKLKITFNRSGEVTISARRKERAHTNGQFIIPTVAGWPTEPVPAIRCPILQRTSAAIVIRLPLKEWKGAISDGT